MYLPEISTNSFLNDIHLRGDYIFNTGLPKVKLHVQYVGYFAVCIQRTLGETTLELPTPAVKNALLRTSKTITVEQHQIFVSKLEFSIYVDTLCV